MERLATGDHQVAISMKAFNHGAIYPTWPPTASNIKLANITAADLQYAAGTFCSQTFTHSLVKSFALFMLQINLPNTNKENVDVDYFKTRNGRFHNVLQCTGIAINFIRGYLIHCYMKKVYIF